MTKLELIMTIHNTTNTHCVIKSPRSDDYDVHIFTVGKYQITIKHDVVEYIYNNKSLSGFEIKDLEKINITTKSIVFYLKTEKRILRIHK